MIGIDEYTGGWPRLSMAVKDAQLIAAALKEHDFEVELLLNPKSDELEDALETFFLEKGEDPDARLFVWFAGHGHTENGEGYIVPADAPLPRTRSRFRRSALSLRRLGEYVRQADSKHAFVVFDSCFSGTVFQSARALPPAAVTRATTLPVRQFLTSGDAGQTVSDDGTFRELFIRALRGEERADANSDGYVTASEMGLFLSDRVTNLTESKQTPRYGKLRDKDWDRGDFVFALAGSAGQAAAMMPKRKPATPSARMSPEMMFWQSIQGGERASDYRAYLRQFPNGTFAALARSRIRGDKEKKTAALSPPSKSGSVSDGLKSFSKTPAEYLPLPVGTKVAYNNWTFRVEESAGLKTIVRTGDNDFMTFYGIVGLVGDNIFTEWTGTEVSFGAIEPRLSLTGDNKKSIADFWPLKVGNTVKYSADEFAAGGVHHYSLENKWNFEATVSKTETIKVGGPELPTFVIDVTAESVRGRKFDQTTWYHPQSGLIVKLIRRWAGKKIMPQPRPRENMHTGDVQSYELLHVVFPKDAKNALLAK